MSATTALQAVLLGIGALSAYGVGRMSSNGVLTEMLSRSEWKRCKSDSENLLMTLDGSELTAMARQFRCNEMEHCLATYLMALAQHPYLSKDAPDPRWGNGDTINYANTEGVSPMVINRYYTENNRIILIQRTATYVESAVIDFDRREFTRQIRRPL